MFYDELNNKLNLSCGQCGEPYEADTTDLESNFNEEFGEYENLVFPCPHCVGNRRMGIEMINMNLPLLDEMEMEVMAEDSPFTTSEERAFRRCVRRLMWAVRTDLKEMDYDVFRDDFLS